MTFKVGTYALHNYVVAGKYEVNEEEIVKGEWVDARGVTHYPVIRRRVTGKVDLFFKKKSDFKTFVDKISELEGTNNNLWKITAYINNTCSEKTFDARINFSNVLNLKANMEEFAEPFTLEFEEA